MINHLEAPDIIHGDIFWLCASVFELTEFLKSSYTLGHHLFNIETLYNMIDYYWKAVKNQG